jgi:adenylate cyclase class 2
MPDHGQEIEAKFHVLHLDRIMTRLHDLEARLIQPRVLEINIRFDRPDGSLRSRGQVLRLRHDTQSRLTFKGPGQSDGGILSREEIEFAVEDFEQARKFLHALGYQQSMYYEKYRTTYQLDDTLVMLDELPYGNFVEVEGAGAEAIRAVVEALEIDHAAAVEKSYTALFDILRDNLHLTFDDISFENFKQISVRSSDMNVRVADR